MRARALVVSGRPTDSARRERDTNASAIRDGRGGGADTAMVVHRRCGCCHRRHHPPLSIPPTQLRLPACNHQTLPHLRRMV
jgi:hypothetical protein